MKNLKSCLLLVLLAYVTIVLCGCSDNKDNLTIKYISYNIRYGTADDGDNAWDIRKPATKEMISIEQPDVFGLQEALVGQLEYIDSNFPQYSRVGVGRDDGKEEGEFMAVYYRNDKFKLLDNGNFWLSETPDECSMGWDAACRRIVTWAKLKDKETGKVFYAFNTHLDHVGEEARRKGLALIVERIGDMNKHNLPMVLTGDFKVFPDDSCLTELDMMMKSARVFAAVSDTTASFNNWGREAKVIDYNYYKGFSDCHDFRVVTESFAGKPFISDHYPIVSEFIY